MLHFDLLESLGVRVAAMSDRSDGDCSRNGQDPSRRGDFVLNCGVKAGFVFAPKQVHGTLVQCITDCAKQYGECAFGAADPVEGDGVVTAVPGFPIGISVADCVPLLLFDPVRHAGGVVHAGRVGTRDGIATAAVTALRERLNVAPENLHVVVGPSAGPCCYEVSQELAQEFCALGLPARGRHLDLWRTNQMQLEAAGVPSGQIQISGICTICGERFFSYRRGDQTARNLVILVL